MVHPIVSAIPRRVVPDRGQAYGVVLALGFSQKAFGTNLCNFVKLATQLYSILPLTRQ